MVRNYKRKTEKPKYSKTLLSTAVKYIKLGKLTITEASKHYSIPKATLYDHIKGRRG